MVRFSSVHSPSLTQLAARKQLRKHLRRIREREYSKLRALVPAVATKKKVTKVQVIEEAVRYIEELHKALIERFRQKHGCGAESMAQETVRTFVTRLMPPLRPSSNGSSPAVLPHPHPSSSQQQQQHPHPHSHLNNNNQTVSTPPPLLPRPNNNNNSSSLPPTLPPGVLPPRCPVPAFLSVTAACSFEKQRKRASFLLRRRRKDC